MSIVKWIVCKVVDGNKEKFDEAQREWSKLFGANGFIGQVGGWGFSPEDELNNACILGYWETRELYCNFMCKLHDQITDKSKQENTYQQSTVEIFETKHFLCGKLGPTLKFCKEVTYIHVSRYTISRNECETFLEKLNTNWLPIMESNGLLCGSCGSYSSEVNDIDYWLIITFWDTLDSYNLYKNSSEVENNSPHFALCEWMIPLQATWNVY